MTPCSPIPYLIPSHPPRPCPHLRFVADLDGLAVAAAEEIPLLPVELAYLEDRSQHKVGPSRLDVWDVVASTNTSPDSTSGGDAGAAASPGCSDELGDLSLASTREFSQSNTPEFSQSPTPNSKPPSILKPSAFGFEASARSTPTR